MADQEEELYLNDDGDSNDSENREYEVLPPALTSPSEPPAKYDPLKRYFYEISRYKLLSREEETALATRVYEEHDQDAAYQLVTSNMRLVVKIAMDFHRHWMKNLLDLIQEGNVGLIKAVSKFNPYRGVKFSYYASFWIKAYILKFILDNWHLVRVGTTQAQRKLFFNLNKEKEELLAKGYEPGPKLLADRLNVRERDVIEMDRRLKGWDVSLDAPIREDSSEAYSGILSADEPEMVDILANSQIKEILYEKLNEFRKTLKERDLDILENRILAENPSTLQEMGEKYEISRERVRQLENRIKRSIQKYLMEEIPDLNVDDILSVSDGVD